MHGTRIAVCLAMAKSDTTFIAVGGGEFAEAVEIVEFVLGLLSKRSDPRITILTVATTEPDGAILKYNTLFRGRGIHHVESVKILVRTDAINERAIEKIHRADALYFTGGDQLNVTTLLGGTPLHDAIREKVAEGTIIIGTSAGASMMSKWMITSGDNDKPPSVGSIEIAPGMDLLNGMIIDVHFSQRGRHGRLLTAIAHYPHALGVGIDVSTAAVFKGNEMRVVGEGVVTVIDGSPMTLNDLPYKREGETLGMSGVVIDILPRGYKYDLNRRQAISPAYRTLVNGAVK